MKISEFLISKHCITKLHLKNALMMQKHNKS